MDESSQEAWARSVVATCLGVELEFVDTDGRVDYKFTDPAGRAAAMEVTTLTDKKLKGSVVAYGRTRNVAGSLASMGSCWSVAVDERDATFKGLEARLEPHLALLEEVDVERGRWWKLHELRVDYRSVDVDAAVAAPAYEKVRLLMRWTPEVCEVDAVRRGPHSHGMQVSTTGDFDEVGTNVALEAIETFVGEHRDNLRKLAESGAEVKHLFICLDDETNASVSHSVSRRFAAPPVDGRDYFGLPGRPPLLPVEVDELWVVYEREREGWHWGDGHWEQVETRW